MIARRSVIAAGAALAVAPGFARSKVAALDISLKDPARATDIFVRMRTRGPGLWGVWAYSGVFIVKPEGELARKLCRIDGMSFNRATRLADGGWRYELEECGYWCDLASGRPISELVNPFTGKTVRPRPYRSPQVNQFRDMTITSLSTNLPVGLIYQGSIAAPIRVGETLFMTEDLFVKTPPMPPRGPRVQTSMATFASPIAALRRDGFVPADFTYNTMNSFVPWLEMDGMPGVQSMRLAGRKAIDSRIVPEWLRTCVAADHLDFLTKEGRPG